MAILRHPFDTERVPLSVPSTGSNPLAGPTLGFFGVTGTARPTGFEPVPSAGMSKTAAVTAPTAMNTAFVGNLLDLTQALRITDGNNLRVAYESLRTYTIALAAQHNQLMKDLTALGIIAEVN